MKREEKNMSFRCFFNNRKDNEAAFQRTKRKRPPIITRIYNSEIRLYSGLADKDLFRFLLSCFATTTTTTTIFSRRSAGKIPDGELINVKLNVAFASSFKDAYLTLIIKVWSDAHTIVKRYLRLRTGWVGKRVSPTSLSLKESKVSSPMMRKNRLCKTRFDF